MDTMIDRFSRAAEGVGATLIQASTYSEISEHIARTTDGPVAIPQTIADKTPSLVTTLNSAGISTVSANLKRDADSFHGGLTWGQYGMAETGSVLIHSTDEDVRLCSTLPTIHYLLLNKTKILNNISETTPIMRDIFSNEQASFVAWVTGPSRTADIERVLTIGVHGPKELHIFLIPDEIAEVQS